MAGKRGTIKDWQGMGVLIQLSWALAFSVLLPLGLGILLDRTLHTSPLFFFVGALFGIVAGTVGAVRIATRAIEQVESMKKSDADGSEPKEGKAER